MNRVSMLSSEQAIDNLFLTKGNTTAVFSKDRPVASRPVDWHSILGHGPLPSLHFPAMNRS